MDYKVGDKVIVDGKLGEILEITQYPNGRKNYFVSLYQNWSGIRIALEKSCFEEDIVYA